MSQLRSFKFLAAVPDTAEATSVARVLLMWAQEMPRRLKEWNDSKDTDSRPQANQTILEGIRAFSRDLSRANETGAARRVDPDILMALENLANEASDVLEELEG